MFGRKRGRPAWCGRCRQPEMYCICKLCKRCGGLITETCEGMAAVPQTEALRLEYLQPLVTAQPTEADIEQA